MDPAAPCPDAPAPDDSGAGGVCALVGERLSLAAFAQLAGNLAGYPFVKLVLERASGQLHFLNNAAHDMHGDYIAKHFYGITRAQLEADIDRYNHGFYADPDRELLLAVLSLHRRPGRTFFTLETVEIDVMGPEMLLELYRGVRDRVDPTVPILVKPANHHQEGYVGELEPGVLPRVWAHELFSTAPYIPLNPGTARGRLRVFHSEAAYQEARGGLEWYDIVAMAKVPDDIPRLSGIVNAAHTTPLSHTNVLATGWGIPNCIQIGVLDSIEAAGLAGRWVELVVEQDADEVGLRPIERPPEVDQRPRWKSLRVQLEAPGIDRTPIARLDELRAGDRYRYGTKAANLGELLHVARHGSARLTGFYRIPRGPRENLLPQLARLLGVPEDADLEQAAWDFLRQSIRVPKGIAIPFSLQQEVLESSPRLQQALGKLKMALELEARQADSICVKLQQMIRDVRIPEKLKGYIDAQIARTLAGCSSFVVRSSSNAEDLEGFSAAGIYDSINHVSAADKIFESIKQVWASLLSPRSVRLRQEVGIALDDCYMGVIVQEEVPAELGGVLVTANPMKRDDFRNVYLNTAGSVQNVVEGQTQPYQYLYNIIEGGGRTLSLGSHAEDLGPAHKAVLQKLAIVGRLLQAHFSPDYTFAAPVDIEWLADAETVQVLQLRPYDL